MKGWNWNRISIDVVAGAIGVGLVLAALHLYVDHRNLHTLIDLVNANVQKQNAGQAQSPQPVAPAK